MAWKWQHHDVSRLTGGDLTSALGRIKAKVFVISIEGDMLCPFGDCESDHRLTPGSERREIQSRVGHLALFALEPSYVKQVDQYLGELLEIPTAGNAVVEGSAENHVLESTIVK